MKRVRFIDTHNNMKYYNVFIIVMIIIILPDVCDRTHTYSTDRENDTVRYIMSRVVPHYGLRLKSQTCIFY